MTDLTALDELIKTVEAGHEGMALHRAMPDGISYDHVALIYHATNGSLDAAKALHDALLPGWMMPCIVPHYLNGNHGVTVELYEKDGTGESIETHDDMARAWLLAILKALRAQIGGAA